MRRSEPLLEQTTNICLFFQMIPLDGRAWPGVSPGPQRRQRTVCCPDGCCRAV